MENKILLVVEELRESWTNMFKHIDSLFDSICLKYPEFKNKINYEIFQQAIEKTEKLEGILTEAQKQHDEKQGKIPF
jgi:hypothetical protein